MDYKRSLEYAIKTIAKQLKTDFGQLYVKQFSLEDELIDWKRRAWVKLKGLHPQDILDGYEMLIEKKPSHMPTIPEITEATLFFQKQRKQRDKDNVEAVRIAGLPKPEMSEPGAKQNLKKIHEMLCKAFKNYDKKETEKERKARALRLEEKRLAHEKLLRQSIPLYGKTIIDQDHKCQVGWCDRPGVLSGTTSGGSNFFCNEHFKQGS